MCIRDSNEHLPHAGKADAVVRDLAQFLFIIRDAAAGAAKRIGLSLIHI